MTLSQKMSRWDALREEITMLELDFETEVINSQDNPWMLALENIFGHASFDFTDYFPSIDRIALRLSVPLFNEFQIPVDTIYIPMDRIDSISVEEATDELMEQIEEQVRLWIDKQRAVANHAEWMLNEMISTKQYKRLAYYNTLLEDGYHE